MLRALVLSSIFIFGEAVFVASLPKCGMSDSVCQTEVFQAVLGSIGKTGIKELGIPPIDPLEIQNLFVSVSNLVDIGMVEGVVKGIKDCKVNRIETDIPRRDASVDVTCDVTMKGHYKASSSSPLIKTLLGGDTVRGDGIGKVKIEKLHVHIDFKLDIYRDEDGEVYMAGIYNQTKCKFDILGNVVFSGNNIFLGDIDISDLAIRLLNQNAKSFAPFLGAPFMEKAIEVMYTFTGKFFRAVPARFYIKEDLSQYVRN